MMQTHPVRLFVVLLAVAACFVKNVRADEPKESPFQELATGLLGGAMMHMIEYGHFPHFASFHRAKGDLDDETRKCCKRFPVDLIEAFGKQRSADQETAITSLAVYASYARRHALDLSSCDPARQVELAFAPHTEKIRKALVASLQEVPKTRLFAALTLLTLDDKDARANQAFAVAAKSATEPTSELCMFLGVARISSAEVLEYLRALLAHCSIEVRHQAANAIITMGPAARDVAPALVAFFQTGEEARGTYQYPFAITSSQEGNLALMAIESLQEHGRPAVPAILARFSRATDEDKIAMLACLASIRCKGKDCVALVRSAFDSKQSKLQLTAACTLLHLAPDDPRATRLIVTALKNEATRDEILEICGRVGPPSRAVVDALLPYLESKKEDTRISATRALAKIGPSAAKAVPAIERLLAKEENPQLYTATSHTFQSLHAAANALARIGGKDAASALMRVAGRDVGGSCYALMYLPQLGDDLPPNAVEVVTRALKSEERKLFAAMALSNLGERARPARRSLENLLDDPDIGWIVDTALRRIPAER